LEGAFNRELLPEIVLAKARTTERERERERETGRRRDMALRSRGAFHPSFASFITLIKDKGAGKAGWPLHPGPPRKEICASAREPQVRAVTTGLPCAMVYDLLRAPR
jgi:hypothetical protein